MGILRSDRVSGLGGANAINGSVFFPQNSFINVEPDSDLAFPGDFTIEMWTRLLAGPNITDNGRQLSSKGYFTAGSDGNWYFGLSHYSAAEVLFYSYDGQSGAESVPGNIATPDLDRWYHIAAARSGSTLKVFLDGSEVGSGTLSKGLDDGGNNGLLIGGNSKYKGTDTYGDAYGWISNLRIIKGRALYTADFTVPTGRLEQTSDTVLLCCQSPGNVLEEKTGKILSHNNHQVLTILQSAKEASAERLAPDVGEDHGTTFADNTKFDTLSYMVPPGGTTAESNRGRAVFAGGYSGGPSPAGAETATITYAQIQSMGSVNDFGDLTAARWIPSSGASSTRGTFGGGATPTRLNTIDYVTIATTSNAINFGDLTTLRTYHAGFSNSTRGISGGGNDGSSNINTIDYITIATAGNALDFGDMLEAKSQIVGDCSPTRGLFMGGVVPSKTSTVDYITIASTGNEQAFGDLSAGAASGCALSSNTRAIYAGGDRGSDFINTIGYFTIATLGNETDFGDLITGRASVYAGTSNNIRGVIVAGFTPSPTFNLNSIEYITIATAGNANDFGDITAATRGVTATSDSHGGLS